jgi:uncharacterized protein (DUF1015 family)
VEVIPFRGIRYNQRLVGDLAQVICPPYDVITPEEQRLYYRKSNYNAIRLELPLDSREAPIDRYQRAAVTFQEWLRQGILEADSVSSFYLHDHHFEYSGGKKTRRGLIARVRLEPWGKGIYPHEETSSKAKSDRLELMRACRASFSPLFSLYQDPEQKVTQILSRVAEKKPLLSLPAAAPTRPAASARSHLCDCQESHTLWAITEPEIKEQLSKLLSPLPLYIADGHHRYETALVYQQERAQAHCTASADYACELTNGRQHIATDTLRQQPARQAFNYVMMELVDFSDPGLVVLPIHRLVRGVAPSALAGLEKQLETFFALEFVYLGEDSLVGRGYQVFALSTVAGSSCRRPEQADAIGDADLGILGLRTGALALLRCRKDVSLETLMPADRSPAYRRFGVSILNHIILDNVLRGAKELEVAYTVDVADAYQQIKTGKYQLAFLLSPPHPGMVKAVADEQDRMPRKSTYFYPKLPAGLVINPLD